MKTFLTGSLLLLVTLLIGGRSIAAQTPPSLVGVWRFVEEVDSTADGTKIDFMPRSGFAGQLIYTAGGRFSAQILPSDTLALPYGRLLELTTAYFGWYTVDWARRRVTHHVEGNMVSELGQYQREFALTDKRLVLRGSWTHEGRPAYFAVTWERIE